MGPVATAIAVGCLTALRWLLWLTAALLVVLIAMQFARGDQWAQPGANAALAAAMAVGGWLSGYAADWLTRR